MLAELVKRKVRVLRHKAQCDICGAKTEFYSDVPDEGFGYAAVLYENEFGREVFFHSEEDRAYRGSPAERIIELNEAFVRDGEKIKIRRRQPVAALCPTCDSRRLESSGDQDEVIIEAYELFGPNA
jgi:hypothetical protein